MSTPRLLLVGTACLLGACVTTLPYTVPVPVEARDPAAPTAGQTATSVTDTADTLAQIQAQIAQLQQQMADLHQRQTALSQSLSIQTTARPGSSHSGTDTPLSQAQQQYRAGLYAQAVRTLAGADSGGNGSTQAQEAMWLLAQSHERLNHCESAINIATRFVRRFPRHARAADALWLVGQCQWRMQQQDIARDTWRKLMHTYPDSAAARRAAQHLQQRR